MRTFIISIVLLVSFMFSGVAQANILDDMESTFFTGVVLGGEPKTMIQNETVFTPKKELFCGIPMTWAELKIIQFGSMSNGGDSQMMLSEFTYAATLWESNDYFLSIKQIDEPYNKWGGGGLYSITNLDKNLPPFLIGVYVMDAGDLLYTLEGDWQFTPGYFLGCDLQYATGIGEGTNKVLGDIHVKHNFKPTGDFFGMVGIMDLWNNDMMFFGGIGGFTDIF